MIVEHAGKNLSAYIEDAPVITVGNDMKEIEDNVKEAIELYLEDNSNPCEVLSGEFEANSSLLLLLSSISHFWLCRHECAVCIR